MKKIVTITIAVLVILLSANARGQFVYDFDHSDGGWQAVRLTNWGQISYEQPTWHNSGGNDGGYISAGVDLRADKLYCFEAPDAGIFGDMTGGSMSVDYKIDGKVDSLRSVKMRFYVGSTSSGNNYFVSDNAHSWNPNSAKQWNTFQVDLAAENFLEWPNQAAHNKTFEEVIASPADIGLVLAGTFTSNFTLGVSSRHGATLSIDNFKTVGSINSSGSVPEPTTILLLGIGTIFLGCGRTRKQK